MSIRIKNNISSIVTTVGKGGISSFKRAQVGRVYGVVTTENTPTPAMFLKAGGWNGIGTIFYLSYEQAVNTSGTVEDSFLDTCKIAKPLYPQFQYYPILGELVFLEDLASPISQISNNAPQKYYIASINIWNNQQQNSQPANKNDSIGVTFVENPQVKTLLPFEGDHILQGRQGAALRFSSTTKLYRGINEWSNVGSDIDPITILTNGFNYNPNEKFHVEQINKDLSSIYLTSTQQLPLQTDKNGVLNNLTNPLNIPDYFGAQTIINSDRIVINSKKDEVMIFAKTNVEINTKNIINLNADERVHLNTNTIFLGPYNSTNMLQPVLLGNETVKLLIQLNKTLTRLAGYLSSAVSTAEGSPIVSLKAAGTDLTGDIKRLNKLLNNITSKKVFTA
jgi:hypothetical protein